MFNTLACPWNGQHKPEIAFLMQQDTETFTQENTLVYVKIGFNSKMQQSVTTREHSVRAGQHREPSHPPNFLEFVRQR